MQKSEIIYLLKFAYLQGKSGEDEENALALINAFYVRKSALRVTEGRRLSH